MTSLNSPPDETLYRRLGGYDVISAVIDEFLSRFGSDPGLVRFGGGRSLDSRQRARQLLVDQICSLAGGPCVHWPGYEDRARRPRHHGGRVVQHASAALEKYGVALGRRKSFWRFFSGTRTISSRSLEAPPRAGCRAASGAVSLACSLLGVRTIPLNRSGRGVF